MNRNVTISVRTLLLTAVAVLALGVAYLLGGAGGGATAGAAHASAPAPDRRELTMTGTGKATAVPDQVSFGLSVGVTRADLATALDDANARMRRVLAALAKHDVARSDVQTTGLSMNAVYAYHDGAPPTITGYRVSQRASVIVRDRREGGAAVSAAVAAGGNAVRAGNIRLLVGDTDAVMKRAREAAVAEATAKAEQYAAASGQQLGAVLSLREIHARPIATPTYPQELAGAFDAARSPVPVRPGRDRTSVTVRIVWELA